MEHIFSYDVDDEISEKAVGDEANSLANPALGPRISAVRNWNAAARRARGDLLLVIADDLRPPERWDESMLSLISDLDPQRAMFVMKLTDDQRSRDRTIRHPLVSRAYYSAFGLWNPLYTGYGVDNEFTLCAHRRGLVIDGRAVLLAHEPKHLAAGSESADKMRIGDDTFGLFESRYEPWQRYYRPCYVRVRPGRPTLRPADVLIAKMCASTGYMWGCLPDTTRTHVRSWVG